MVAEIEQPADPAERGPDDPDRAVASGAGRRHDVDSKTLDHRAVPVVAEMGVDRHEVEPQAALLHRFGEACPVKTLGLVPPSRQENSQAGAAAPATERHRPQRATGAREKAQPAVTMASATRGTNLGIAKSLTREWKTRTLRQTSLGIELSKGAGATVGGADLGRAEGSRGRDGLVSGRLVGRTRVVQLNPAYFARVRV